MSAPRGRLLHDEPLARHTSWRIGGPARTYYEPQDIDDLAEFLRQLPAAEPIHWLGLGSNLLVRDGGVAGTVIATFRALGAMTRLDERHVRVEAGVACPQVARFCSQQGLTGVEFLAGIPGTLGGALAMNAGAFGGETWSHVESVETLDRQGERRVRPCGDYRIGYRSVEGPAGEWFVAAVLRLKSGDSAEVAERIRELLDKRKATQPLNLPSCGSVFRNPPGDHAARLIESAGLKGLRIGDACVSQKHANFIVNLGAASAADVEALIAQIMERVEAVHGVRLVPEVRIVGEPVEEVGNTQRRDAEAQRRRGDES